MLFECAVVLDPDPDRFAEDYGMFSQEGELAVTQTIDALCIRIERTARIDREQACGWIGTAINEIFLKHPEVLDTAVLEEIGWRLAEAFATQGWDEWCPRRDLYP